jgi:hypothetical protein
LVYLNVDHGQRGSIERQSGVSDLDHSSAARASLAAHHHNAWANTELDQPRAECILRVNFDHNR